MTESNLPADAGAPRSLTRPTVAGLPARETPPDDWGEMGRAFEGMCKAGLALTVGFSVAAAFCKMMDARNADVTGVVNKLAGGIFRVEEPPAEKPH